MADTLISLIARTLRNGCLAAGYIEDEETVFHKEAQALLRDFDVTPKPGSVGTCSVGVVSNDNYSDYSTNEWTKLMNSLIQATHRPDTKDAVKALIDYLISHPPLPHSVLVSAITDCDCDGFMR